MVNNGCIAVKWGTLEIKIRHFGLVVQKIAEHSKRYVFFGSSNVPSYTKLTLM